MITLDFSNRKPIYEQLQVKITQMALTGTLEPNEQLPSVRSLAKDLMINPNTVQKAYQFLEQDGVIYSVPGKGSFISPDISVSSKYREETVLRLRRLMEEAKAYGVKQTDVEKVMRSVFNEEEGEKE